MGEDLFGDLPPPSHQPPPSDEQPPSRVKDLLPDPLPPPPAIKSALKRPKPPPSTPDDGSTEKRLRFKTTTDVPEAKIIEAMEKIASHVKNPAKFSKASKLAIQLIQAGNVKPETSDNFFLMLEAAMSSPTSCNDASVRSDIHALFSAAEDASQWLNKKQKKQFNVWKIKAVVANDLYTDDSFVFSRASTKIKELISSLPVATEEEDNEEASTLKDETQTKVVSGQKEEVSSDITKVESDPFGLDALISDGLRKDENTKEKKETSKSQEEEEDERKKFLRLQREALIICLEIAAKRYKTPWCQTGIDILAKHAVDNVSRFTSRQRDAIEKLWASIREQHIRRKQGKSVSGKLDVNGFEWLQQKYASEKISIRHAVGGAGDRKCTQWLG